MKEKEPKKLTPADYGKKCGISPQAVMKKIHNTLANSGKGSEEKSNALPEGVTVEQFGRVYIIRVPDGFKFVKAKKAKKKK